MGDKVCTKTTLHLQVDLPVLERLEIGGIRTLKEIWSNQISIHSSSFCHLTELNVYDWNKLLHLVPKYMQNRLQKLERIDVHDCPLLEEIFEFRRFTGDEDEGDTPITISESREPPSISQPEGTQLKKMDSQQTHQGLQNLTSISISHCNRWRNLLSSTFSESNMHHYLFLTVTV